MSFDSLRDLTTSTITGLNPFRAGRCLSTENKLWHIVNQQVSIPFEQGNVFRPIFIVKINANDESQSLSSRAMSFDPLILSALYSQLSSQSLSSRAMSFDKVQKAKTLQLRASQSLSSRAMSFDELPRATPTDFLIVSIPFEQGDVFRLMKITVSSKNVERLNPFRAGRCLSTVLQTNI